MLVHLRLNLPTDLARTVLQRWLDDERMTDVACFPAASRRPAGDVLEADVAREAVSAVLEELTELGVDSRGGIVLTQPMGTPFATADRVEKDASGDPDDAVVWRVVERTAVDSSRVTPAFLFFLCIAVALAAIAVLTDSAVLVVGAMVVGPEFATVAAVCTGLALGRWRLAARSAWSLVWAFATATAAVAALAWAASVCGAVSPADLTAARPQTGFIWRPDMWSFVVALLAGAAGVWALATDKSSAMVGVFISVTTVPAAGNLALGLALGVPSEIAGSALQLGVNLVGMVLAGVATLTTQRILWRRIGFERRHRWTRMSGR